METLSIGGGHWLEIHAALSLLRCWADGCPEAVTDAGRTRDEQQALRDAYEAGTGNFAWPADDPRANHVGGRAVDLPWGGRTWMLNKGAADGVANPYGFSAVTNEPWHFNYNPAHDTHLEENMSAFESAVWNYAMNGGDEMSGGDQVPHETAGERLRQIRRSTSSLRARTLNIEAQVAGLTAAVEAMAKSQGLDAAEVTAAVKAGVSAAMDRLKITIDSED